MNESKTPRTDAIIGSSERCVIKHARQLETALAAMIAERDSLKSKLEVETALETCSDCGRNWSPSIIESGHCVFCLIKSLEHQRDEARNLCAMSMTKLGDFGDHASFELEKLLDDYNQAAARWQGKL